MCPVTTTDAISQKIGADIKTVDAQESLGGGAIVLITGLLTNENNLKWNCTQSFFRAPQGKGYHALNDIFRLMDEFDLQQRHQGLGNGTGAPNAAERDLPPEQEEHAPGPTVPLTVVEEEELTGVVIDEVSNSSLAVVVESKVVTVQEEMPKKSYASVLVTEEDMHLVEELSIVKLDINGLVTEEDMHPVEEVDSAI
ncbi:Nuclear transport factor 2 (NTF2) domain [Musa troglodytarum]|uniref:Nuclear transport factor 2 (NTF2) domain n=1 Tax=Musa troglodytarum TaxID=320322 RepID=A0A9E7JKX2_9LILI|nr:Nuclear transport factor 2 (NTF2) domain [Musa troglodytarum]URD84796.1 Nuclear transport factor 2 (NTF2) domain [Musa troglodytarum]